MRIYLKKAFAFLLLLLVVFPACLMSACGHQHTFSTTWSYDETYHWRESTCEHDEIADKGVHNSTVREETDGDDVYIVTYCSVCGKEFSRVLHIHTFNTEEWSHDEHQHWHPSTCGHGLVRLDLANHVEVVECITLGGIIYDQTKCSVCGYQISRVLHQHTFGDDWDYDETNHWHNATCGHNDVKGDLTSHDFAYNLVGEDEDALDVYTCRVCGFVKTQPHQHTFEDEYSADETYHWHECTCGHDEFVQKELHNRTSSIYQDDDRYVYIEYCIDCGYVFVKQTI